MWVDAGYAHCETNSSTSGRPIILNEVYSGLCVAALLDFREILSPEYSSNMDKLQLTGRNLGFVFNSRSDWMFVGAGKTMYILSARFRFIANLSWPNLTCLSPSPSLAVSPPLAYYASPHLA